MDRQQFQYGARPMSQGLNQNATERGSFTGNHSWGTPCAPRAVLGPMGARGRGGQPQAQGLAVRGVGERTLAGSGPASPSVAIRP